MDARIKQISHKPATFKTDETGYTEITKPCYALVTFEVDTDSHSELAELRELEDMSRNKEYVRITAHKSQRELELSEPGQIRGHDDENVDR